MLVHNNPRAAVVVHDKGVDDLQELRLLNGLLDACARGLHSSTFRLNVSTFRGIRWVVFMTIMAAEGGQAIIIWGSGAHYRETGAHYMRVRYTL